MNRHLLSLSCRSESPAPRLALGAGLLLSLLLVACTPAGGEGATRPAGGTAGGGGPGPAEGGGQGAAVAVGVQKARVQDFVDLQEATGSVLPVASVDVRPQITSVVQSIAIREGQFVRAGELLFTLDGRQDASNVAKARAQMARDEAALADARRQLKRNRELLGQGFVSQGAVDSAQAQVDAQVALVAADRAALEAARLGLSYVRVTAPGAGRVGAIPVSVGSSVQANQTTLVTITQLDPIDVGFALPQRELPEALAALGRGGVPVTAVLPDGGGQVQGRLNFVDSVVDAATGTVKVKARFANAEHRLWPGAFVRVQLSMHTLKEAVVIPRDAIIQGPQGKLVYVVDAATSQAQARPVTELLTQGAESAVQGLKGGEAVVVEGRQNVKAGSLLRVAAAGVAPSASAPAPARP